MVEDPSIPPSCWNSLPQPTNGSGAKAVIIHVKIFADHCMLYSFTMKTTSKMSSLMSVYSIQSGTPIGRFRFFYKGRLVDKEDTVTSLGLTWGAFIIATTLSEQDTSDDTSSESD
ncbi:hypothetical protein KR074_002014 [Drosophila pseudoananassae]|nr:hypothetical protein KR074_002014 [Drosophila pseudoananassae]